MNTGLTVRAGAYTVGRMLPAHLSNPFRLAGFLAATAIGAVTPALPCSAQAASAATAPSPDDLRPRVLRTPDGVEFGIRGSTARTPAPLLLHFTSTIDSSLADPTFNRIGDLVLARGWRVAAIDLPCHGKERRAGEPAGLDGWCQRIAKGEQPIGEFCHRVSVVIGIGNDDQRVSTDDTVRLARLLVEANKARKLPADVELHVYSYDDHRSLPENHDALAAWLLTRTNSHDANRP